MNFEEFWEKYCKENELDVWNMSLESYNYHKNIVWQLYRLENGVTI